MQTLSYSEFSRRVHREVNATDWANWLGIATGLGALVLWAAAGSPLASELVDVARWALFSHLAWSAWWILALGSIWL